MAIARPAFRNISFRLSPGLRHPQLRVRRLLGGPARGLTIFYRALVSLPAFIAVSKRREPGTVSVLRAQTLRRRLVRLAATIGMQRRLEAKTICCLIYVEVSTCGLIVLLLGVA